MSCSPGASYTQTDPLVLVIAVGVDMTLQTKAAGAEGLQFDKIFFKEHTFQNRLCEGPSPW